MVILRASVDTESVLRQCLRQWWRSCYQHILHTDFWIFDFEISTLCILSLQFNGAFTLPDSDKVPHSDNITVHSPVDTHIRIGSSIGIGYMSVWTHRNKLQPQIDLEWQRWHSVHPVLTLTCRLGYYNSTFYIPWFKITTPNIINQKWLQQ